MIFALAFTGVLSFLVLFQTALALGAPWGEFAWGGQSEGTLPRKLRIGSALSIVVYATMVVVVLDRATVIDVLPHGFSVVATWFVFGFLALGILMNAASRSSKERAVMTPVVVVLAVLALFVALGAG